MPSTAPNVHARKVVVFHVAVEQVSRQSAFLAESFHLSLHPFVVPCRFTRMMVDQDDETQAWSMSRAQPVAEHSSNGSSR